MIAIEIQHLAFVTDVGNFDDLMCLAVSIASIASKTSDGQTISALFVLSGYQASSDELKWFKQVACAVASKFPRLNFDFHVVKVEEAALPNKKRYFDDREAYELIRANWGLDKYDHVPKNVSWIAPELSNTGHKPKYDLHVTCPLFINAPFSVSWFTGPKRWIDASATKIILGLGYNTSKVLPFESNEYDGNKDRSKEQLETDLRKLAGACDQLCSWNGYFSAGSHETIKNIGKVAEGDLSDVVKMFHRWGQVVSKAFAASQCRSALENARADGGDDWTLGGLFPVGCDPFEVLRSMSDKDQASDAAKKLFAASFAHSQNSYHHPETGNGLKATVSFLTNPEAEFSDPVGFMLWFLCSSKHEESPLVDFKYCYLVNGRLKLETDIPDDDDSDYLEISAYVARDALAVQQAVFETLNQVDKLLLA